MFFPISIVERMAYLGLAAIISTLTFTILFPERMVNIIYFRIPREMRPKWSANLHAPSIALLVFGTFFFNYVHRNHPQWFVYDPRDALAQYLAGAAFAALGFFLCIKPVRGLKQFIQPLRGISDGSIERAPHLVLGAKVVGVISIVGSALWLSRMLS